MPLTGSARASAVVAQLASLGVYQNPEQQQQSLDYLTAFLNGDTSAVLSNTIVNPGIPVATSGTATNQTGATTSIGTLS